MDNGKAFKVRVRRNADRRVLDGCVCLWVREQPHKRLRFVRRMFLAKPKKEVIFPTPKAPKYQSNTRNVSGERSSISAKLRKSTLDTLVVSSYNSYTSAWKPGISIGQTFGPSLLLPNQNWSKNAGARDAGKKNEREKTTHPESTSMYFSGSSRARSKPSKWEITPGWYCATLRATLELNSDRFDPFVAEVKTHRRLLEEWRPATSIGDVFIVVLLLDFSGQGMELIGPLVRLAEIIQIHALLRISRSKI